MRTTSTHDIKLLVTDLDNTLYDWVSSFVPAFYAMAEKAAEILNVDIELLLTDLRAVHQHYGSSEHPFALLDTNIVQITLPHMDRLARKNFLDEAFHRFNSVRKRTLTLYETVESTLKIVAEANIPIVAYTDARIPNSLYRLKRLELDHYISRLYAPASRFPTGHDAGIFDKNFLHVLPEDDKKPNPQTLLDICKDYSVPPFATLYVGDSLSRDIYMANRANVYSAWARYGTKVDQIFWEKLVRVTHWTMDDVKNEDRLKSEAAGAKPDIILDRYSDLLSCVATAT